MAREQSNFAPSRRRLGAMLTLRHGGGAYVAN